ncbi:host specificity factor TipJ family phage tail protein [Chitinibacter tainanensis]|uniref:host specificity factor TipJ family phage tail protein n=1 Tax=Chitinibacter tainanensis TaxID=230667 RepID=UPI0003F5D7FF|nr:host specificity factor TipJ family phage tail protein [Chitinibacter tainanensis]
MLDDQTQFESIKVVEILNPFNPTERILSEKAWLPELSAAEAFPMIIGASERVISVNGQVLTQEQELSTYLMPGDSVVICPVPQGGKGGGKSILRLVAMIAIAIVAPYGAPYLAQAFGATSAAAISAAGAAIMAVGSMAVNALIPAPKPKLDPMASSLTDSQTYGLDGPKNTSVEGVPFPVCYGSHRMAGNVIGVRVDNDGNTNNQYLYMLIAVGEGPISAISDLEINDLPITTYKDYEYHFRQGDRTPNGGALRFFGKTYTPISAQRKLTTDWSYFETQGEVDNIRLDFLAPSGLVQINEKDGSKMERSVFIEAQVRLKGTGDWFNLQNQATILRYEKRWYYRDGTISTEMRPGLILNNGGWPYYSGTSNRTLVRVLANPHNAPPVFEVVAEERDHPIYGTAFKMTDKVQSPVRRSLLGQGLAEGQYEIRVRRTDEESKQSTILDQVVLSDINEIVDEPIAYSNTALLELRIKMSDQINSLPKVTYVCHGRILRCLDANLQPYYAFTANPAWVVLDMLSHYRYGGGMNDNRLNLRKFFEWAQHCEQNSLKFNAVIDTSMNMWEALQYPLRSGHAQLVREGTRWSLAIERAAAPVMMFSVANIMRGSFSQNWLPTADRVNEVELTYFDEKEKYEQKTIRVVDAVAQNRGLMQKSTSLQMIGCTSREQAFKEATLLLNINRYITQSITFDAAIDAIGCRVGDVILVQHDMPQWGYAGRLDDGCSTTTLKLDRPVPITNTKQHCVLVKYDVLQRATGPILSVVGNSITVADSSGWTPTTKVKRVLIGGVDYEVMSQGAGATGTTVIVLDRNEGIRPGLGFTAFDTDVLEERIVTPANGEIDVLRLNAPLPAAPNQYQHWMFGPIDKVKKPFRVTAITGNEDWHRTIEAIEYNESVYRADGVVMPTPNYSDLQTSIKHSVITAIDEELFIEGGAVKSRVIVMFDNASEFYRSSTVKVRSNGGQWRVVDAAAAKRASFEAKQDDQIEVMVIARDVVGISLAEETAPRMAYKVLGKLAPPKKVQNFRYSTRMNDVLLEWSPNNEVDVIGYQIRQGPSWDSGSVVVERIASTSYAHKLTEEGRYFFHIRAIDDGERLSSEVATIRIDLAAPAPVRRFNAVQSSRRVEFSWEPNPEKDIAGYEIRQGMDWDTGKTLTTTLSTAYSTPAGAEGDLTFFIKAIRAPGIYSKEASFFTTSVAVPSNVNMIAVQKEAQQGWNGFLEGMKIESSDGLPRMEAGRAYAEYIYQMVMPDTKRGYNIVDFNFEAIRQDYTSWSQASFAWGEREASRNWQPTGSMDDLMAKLQIAAPYPTMWEGHKDGWRFDGNLKSAREGELPSANKGISYRKGRYANGVFLSDLSQLEYGRHFGPVFGHSMWVRITVEPAHTHDLLKLSNPDGEGLTLSYSASRQAFLLQDHFGRVIEVPMTVQVGAAYLVGIEQTAEERSLRIGQLESRLISSATKPFEPAKAVFTKVKLA